MHTYIPGVSNMTERYASKSAVQMCLLQGQTLPLEAVTVIRKSFDARAKHRNFVYVVDVDAAAAKAAGAM